jgi:hypothetical protein
MAPRTVDPETQTLPELIERIARGEISEEEGRRQLEILFSRLPEDSWARRVLRELPIPHRPAVVPPRVGTLP